MPSPSNIQYELTQAHNGKRVRLEVAGSVPVDVKVGNPAEQWSDGCFIEVVRVSATAPVSFVAYDGSVTLNFLNAQQGTSLLNGEHARVCYVSPGVWDLTIYPAQARFVATLDQLADVETTGATSGDALVFNGTTWTPAAPAPVTTTLDQLTDVETTGAASGDALVFNGTTWAPAAVSTAPTVVKPAPLTTVLTSATTLDIGSSAHHNSHYRVSASAASAIVVQPDSYWTGTDDYTANGYSPLNPGPMPTGGNLIVTKAGSGDVVFLAAPGVTINTPDTFTISRLNGKATLIKVGANVWDLEGNIGLAEGQTSYSLPDGYYTGTVATGKTVLLLHGDSLVDSSANPKTLTAISGATTSSVQSRFGGSALSFSGDGAFLRADTVPDLLLDSGDFTVEAFIYATEVAGATGMLRHVFTQTESLVGNFTYWYCLAVGPSGRLYNYVATSGTQFSSPAGTIQPNTWYHVAFVRQGTSAKVFVDGVEVASTNAWATYPNDKVTFTGIGGIGNGYGDSSIGTFKGYIDEFRVTNGVARYVANFTPPTAPFANGLS